MLSKLPNLAEAPVARLPLATPVTLANGVYGVISGRSTCDCQRYEIAWFDLHFWRVRWGWCDRSTFTVDTNGAASSAADESTAPDA